MDTAAFELLKLVFKQQRFTGKQRGELMDVLREIGTDLHETLQARGKLHIELRGPDGELKQVRDVDNLVVTVGLNFIAALDSDAAPTAMGWLSVGTDNTAAAAGQTTLVSESARVALTSKTQSTNTNVYVATFPAGTGTAALVEAGIFNDVSAGTMLARSTFGTITKGASDTLTVTWTMTFTAS